MMRLLLAAFALSLVLAQAGGARAGEPAVSGADQAAIRGVIEAQLDAFRRDDGAAAFAYASPGIQSRFRTPEGFMEMVRSGYPAVYRPRGVSFRAVRLRAGEPVQEIVFVGPDGQPVLALYSMERQADGSWRIKGVTLVPMPDESV